MTIELKTASYKGIEFLYEEIETTGGNRNVNSLFPGSDSQAVERQGRVPRTFRFVIIIAHENYYLDRDNLIRVFEDGEKGTLVHPTFGSVDNVASGVYTLRERISELGRGIIEVEMTVDDAPGIPVESGASISQVQQAAALVVSQAEIDLANEFDVSPSFPSNLTDAATACGNIVDSFAAAGRVASAAADKLAIYQAEINAFAGKIGDLVRGPAALAAGIAGLFEAQANLYDTTEATFRAISSLFSFGADDPVVNQNTAGRIERKQNRDLLRSNMLIQALAYSYESAAQLQYSTTDDLDITIGDLESVYLDIRDNQTVTNETMELLDRLRVQFGAAIDNAAISPREVVTIETGQIPLSVLLYQYYGHTDYFDEIADLNNITQTGFVEGTIRVFAE